MGFWCWQVRGLWHGGPGAVLAVHEQFQAPLVFTVRRRLSLLVRHDVRDADDDLVGVLASTRLLDRRQRPVMYLLGNREQGRLVDARNVLLASWQNSPLGRRLDLQPLVWPDPFAKMLILAAFLTVGQ